MEGAILSAAHESVEEDEKPRVVPQNVKQTVNAAIRLFAKFFR
jgi:hypothetical protein